jgi:hypothetical protein
MSEENPEVISEVVASEPASEVGEASASEPVAPLEVDSEEAVEVAE